MLFRSSLVFSFFRDAGEETTEIPFSDVIAAGRDGTLERVHVDRLGHSADVTLRGDETNYSSEINENSDVVLVLQGAGAIVGGTSPDAVVVDYEAPSGYGNTVAVLFSFVPWISFPFILYYAVLMGMRKALREDRVREP